MANLVDVFTQTKSTNTDSPLLFSKESDLPKDKPSLFDSLLKTTIENLQNGTKNIKENTSNTPSQNIELNLLNDKEIVNEPNIEILTAEGENLEQSNISTNTNNDVDKNINKDNSMFQNSGSLLDRIISEIKNSNLNNQEQTIKTSVTTVQDGEEQITTIEKEILTKDLNQNSVKIEQSVETTISKYLENTQKIDSEVKVPLIEDSLLEGQDINLKQDKKLSLMDQIILENSKKSELSVKESLNQNSNQSIKDSSLIDKESQKVVSANILLADQKNSLNNQFLFNKHEAVKILEQGSSLEDIEKSAKILDLQADSPEVENEALKESLKNLKLEAKEQQDRKQILNSLLNEKDIRSVDVKNLITNSIEASKALLENKINFEEDQIVEVSTNLTHSIQSRIIGAKQQLTSMMSDIARQMYENYKPPVTAFRINLNPVELGSIAILMRQDRINGLNISMSASSVATLEMLIENQNTLRNSLVKTFNDESNFNLDFSQGQDSNNNQSSNNQHNKNRANQDTNSVLKLKEENRDFEANNDYM